MQTSQRHKTVNMQVRKETDITGQPNNKLPPSINDDDDV
jgi:hypothetical protein